MLDPVSTMSNILSTEGCYPVRITFLRETRTGENGNYSSSLSSFSSSSSPAEKKKTDMIKMTGAKPTTPNKTVVMVEKDACIGQKRRRGDVNCERTQKSGVADKKEKKTSGSSHISAIALDGDGYNCDKIAKALPILSPPKEEKNTHPSHINGRRRRKRRDEETKKNEIVICLLDSSDDDEDEKADDSSGGSKKCHVRNGAKKQTHLYTSRNVKHKAAVPNDEKSALLGSTHLPAHSTYHPPIVSDTDANNSAADLSFGPLQLLSFVANPDPTPAFLPDDFVHTPIGPGRVLSSPRIDRYPSCIASLVHPIVIYHVQLHFGICHLPSTSLQKIELSQFGDRRVITFAGVQLYEKDVLRLWPRTYLNDSLVNFYLRFLQRGRCALTANEVFVFPTYFYTRVSQFGLNNATNSNTRAYRKKMWSDLKGWTKGVDLLQKKFLLLPVNFDLHWTFVLVCNPGRAIEWSLPLNLDSKDISSAKSQILPSTPTTLSKKAGNEVNVPCIIHFDSGKQFRLHRPQVIFAHIRKYLTACYEATTKESCKDSFYFNSKTLPGVSPPVPVQPNTKDCGVYMLELIERILSDPPIVDETFVETRRKQPKSMFSGKYWFDRRATDQKRVDMMRLIRSMERQIETVD